MSLSEDIYEAFKNILSINDLDDYDLLNSKEWADERLNNKEW